MPFARLYSAEGPIMPTKTGYDHGQFSWVDLVSRDAPAACSFYGDLFGWTAVEQATGGGPHYSIFQKDGRDVAGVGQMGEQMQSMGMPSMWNSYVNVDDVQAVAARVAELGGTVTVPPMQVAEAGWMSFLQDPTGASVGLWEKQNHFGAALVNEPGSFCWNELATNDHTKARVFYSALLGWTFEEHHEAPTDYYIIKTAGQDNGGVMQMPAEWGEVPPHWAVYFVTEDTDAAVGDVQRLGGAVNAPAFDTPVGRIAVVSDPQGDVFSIIQMAEAGG